MQGLPKTWLHRPHSLALPSSLIFSHLYFKEKNRRFPVIVSFLLSSRLTWPFQTTEPHKMDVSSFKWGHRKFCWFFPNHSILRSCFVFFLFSQWGPVPSGFLAKCGQCIFTAIGSKGLCSLELPDSWNSWSWGICHSFGGISV